METIIIKADDSPRVEKAKLIAMDVKHMMELKQAIIWWDEDEEKFVERYGCSSDGLHEEDQINKDNLNKLIKENVK